MYEPFVLFASIFVGVVGIFHMYYMSEIANELRKIREHLAKS